MNILMVSSYLPYPLHSGGQVRLYNLIKELSDKHEITLVCEKRPSQTQEDVKTLEKFCKRVVTVDRRKQWTMENIAKSGISTHSFLVTGHTLPQMQEKITQLLHEETFDVIHVETFYVMQNVPATSLPVVLVEHNIEYQVYQRFMNRVPIVLKPLLKIDIAKIRKEEENFWKQSSKVVAVSEEDRNVIEKNGLKADLVPNGVNIEQFSFKAARNNNVKRILFIGDFKWIQNRDSVEFIIKEIWPILANSKWQMTNGRLKLWIVARSIPEAVRRLTNDPNVLFDEESSAKQANEIFQEADVLLAPIRVGGGTSYKILESMSCGTPVVAMQMSASAIHAVDGKDIMVGKVAQELADKTITLLDNEKVYKTIATNGRKLIEEHYSWKMIAEELSRIYNLLA